MPCHSTPCKLITFNKSQTLKVTCTAYTLEKKTDICKIGTQRGIATPWLQIASTEHVCFLTFYDSKQFLIAQKPALSNISC